MRCLALALRDFAPQTSGGPLYESLLLYAVLSCCYRGTQIVFFRAVVDSTIANISVRSVVLCMWNASPIV